MRNSLNRFYFEFRLQNVKIVIGNHFNFLKCSRLFLANKTGIIRCSTYTTDMEPVAPPSPELTELVAATFHWADGLIRRLPENE